MIRYDRWVYPEEDYTYAVFDPTYYFNSVEEMVATRDNFFLQWEARTQTTLSEEEINRRYPIYGGMSPLYTGKDPELIGTFNSRGIVQDITGEVNGKDYRIMSCLALYTRAFCLARKQARAGGMTEEEINQQHPLGRDPDYYDYYYPNKPPTRDTIREHLERMIQPFRDQGLSETEARKAAQQQFNEYLDSDRFREWRRQWYEKVKK